MTKVMIVEDQPMICETLKSYIESIDTIEVVNIIDDASLAKFYCEKNEVDLILMDVCTANDESGLDASKEIKKYHPEIKIIIITSMPEISFIRKAHETGIESFLYKDCGKETFINAVKDTIEGKSIYPNETKRVELCKGLELTERETEVLALLCEGKTRDEIANILFVSKRTVDSHVENLLNKTGYKSTVMLIAQAISKGYVLPNF